MSNLNELRKKKEILKNEIVDMENLMAFRDKRKSLSFFTNGFTDKFLDERKDDLGNSKLSVKTGEVAKYIGQSVTRKYENNSVLHFNNDGLKENLVENILKVGGIALAGNIAKKALMQSNWKRKIFGTAMVYLLPIAAKFISKKMDEYQRKKSISSLEKII